MANAVNKHEVNTTLNIDTKPNVGTYTSRLGIGVIVFLLFYEKVFIG